MTIILDLIVNEFDVYSSIEGESDTTRYTVCTGNVIEPRYPVDDDLAAKITETIIWCRENFGPANTEDGKIVWAYNGHLRWIFGNSRDAMLFVLRFKKQA